MTHRIMFLSVIAAACIIIPSSTAQAHATDSQVHDFNQSTTIIMDLLLTGNIGNILEAHDPEQLDTLIKNFSPAGMALESEVLSCTLPVMIYFFRQNDGSKKATDTFVEQLAHEYLDHIKIVAVDADKFFSIAQAFNVGQDTPNFITLANRQVLDQVKGSESVGKIITLMHALHNASTHSIAQTPT